nr:hypothetical protein [Tanacetum cinerariifolium]
MLFLECFLLALTDDNPTSDTKLLSAPVSNKTEAYRLFRRNVPIMTLASGSVPAWPTAYTLARALFLPPWLPWLLLFFSLERSLLKCP